MLLQNPTIAFVAAATAPHIAREATDARTKAYLTAYLRRLFREAQAGQHRPASTALMALSSRTIDRFSTH